MAAAPHIRQKKIHVLGAPSAAQPLAPLSGPRRSAHHRRVTRRAPLVATTLLLSLPACGDDGTDPTGATTGLASSTPTAAPTTGDPPPTSTTSADPADSTSTTAAPASTGGDSTTGPAPVTCPDYPPLATSGLLFSGDDHVTMGADPDLGLDAFTLAAWVRRDGPGVLSGTGVGGLKLVPIVAKGRGESDGSNVDCNYAFGFFGDVLGADFEDMESGANHPVWGKTAVPLGQWHHVAATYDGTTWRLYLDGVVDGESVANAVPRFDSIQHFGLGATFDSMGDPAGGLHGAMDEVRVYSRALTDVELRDSMFSSTPDPLGLVGHWRLDAADDDARDTAGDAPGTISGATFETPGAVLDRGPAATLDSPEALDVGDGSHILGVHVLAAADNPTTVEFFARQLTADDDFTLVVLPDTQYYTRDANPPSHPNPDDPSHFEAQTQWAMDHRDDHHVVGLFGLGDIINNSDQNNQWKRASAAYKILEETSPEWPYGLPYAVAFGNHDLFPKDEPEATEVANTYFGPDRYAGRPYYGGNFDGDNDENFVTFRSGDLELVLVSFQYNENPTDELLAWSRSIFESHPRALGMVATHYIVTGGGNFSSQGQAIYDTLKDVDNVQLMASGHVAQDARKSDTFEGNVIHSMLSDYQRSAPKQTNPEEPEVVEQGLTNGGHGYMRIWNFMPSRQTLFVESYSPKKDASYTNDQNEFELRVDLLGAGRGPFTSIGTAEVGDDGNARVTLPNTAPDTVWEWYAVAHDCAHTTEIPLQLLSLLPEP